MNKKHIFSFILILGLTCPQMSFGQIVDSENRLDVTLSDGTQVVLFGKAISLSNRKSKEFYALPTGLKLGFKPTDQKTPEFLFLKFTSEEKEEQGGLNGALLHMLMEWGFTPKQKKELDGILRAGQQGAPKNSVYKGFMDVQPDGEESFRIISATLSDDDLAPTVVKSAKAPVLPGAKVATAARLDKNGAQLLAATFEEGRSITDLSAELSFKYTVRVPGAKGYARVDWKKFHQFVQKDSARYTEKRSKKMRGGLFGLVTTALFGKKEVVDKRSYTEMRSLMDSLVTYKVITMKFEENVADERITKVREAFMQYFMDQMTISSDMQNLAAPAKSEKQAMPNIKYGREYNFKREYIMKQMYRDVQTFRLDYKLAMERYFTLTGNLASWYDQVRDNPKCVSTVNLNDPFFQHRDVQVILDLDAEDMMGKELNYVTVNLRKKRGQKGANDFSKQITFDRKFFQDNGNRATITYSKAQDDDPDAYEYKVKYSLRGGYEFPSVDTTWTKGDWQGITLSPPVEPRTVRFEADLDQLTELDIRNATLQLRYKKFGREIETNVNISLYAEEPYKETTIYMDRGTSGYAYRLIFTHKLKGVMVMDWDAQVNTDYFFAVVPDELIAQDETFIEEAIARGKQIVRTVQGIVKDENAVLDKYKDLFETNQ